MSKKMFDVLMIIVMVVMLALVIMLEGVQLYVKFSMIPLMVFYFLGQYAQRKFGKTA